jgi:hypothetical protein
MRTCVLIILILACFSNCCFGQTLKEEITTTFFKELEQDPSKAYINVFKFNKWMTDKKSALETSRIKLVDLVDQLGEYYGYELITEKRAGESYIIKGFLAKYERQPLRFNFVLYKPNAKWVLQNLSFDVDVDQELSDAAKFDRLKENW